MEEQIIKELETTYLAGLKMGIEVFRLSETVYRTYNKALKKFQVDRTGRLNDNSIRSINVESAKLNGERVISDKN